MNKSYLVSALLAALALLALHQHQTPSLASAYSFQKYKQEYHKAYAKAGEEEYRKAVFQRNLVRIHKHNADLANTWTMGVNQFTDLTDPEFAAIYLLSQAPPHHLLTQPPKLLSQASGEVDWVEQGKVTHVKNQGACGSCWAFGATGATESAYLIAEGATELLSEQDLVDCSQSYGNNGCSGGWAYAALSYIRDKGIATQADYPYTGRSSLCQKKPRSVAIASHSELTGCDSLQNILQRQPVAVSVDASNWSPYLSGIFDNCQKSTNHAVLAVGFTGQYWKVKNSWGSAWGESGYIRLAKGNTCAVCEYITYPTL
jgi:C1A family cysteine protease